MTAWKAAMLRIGADYPKLCDPAVVDPKRPHRIINERAEIIGVGNRMNTEKLNDWLQIVGIFAVVASLLFVGLQLKQSQEIALSQAS